MEKIYLDYMATTPVAPEVMRLMQDYLGYEGCFGNPASNTHEYGLTAREACEKARTQVAALVGAKPHEIIWTSGATESDNLAIKGAAEFYQAKGKHLITSMIEHKAVLDTCHYLESRGFEVTFLKPNADGLITLEMLEKAIRPDTVLASLMHVNNEIGVVNDIGAMGALLKSQGILFHVDAAQSAGKLPIDVESMHIDLMSFSGHKIYGPKGIGALYVRSKPRVRLNPLIHGGGHELGMRSGTLATHQIVGMGEAFAIAGNLMVADYEKLKGFFDMFLAGLLEIPGVHLNGDREHRYPGNINFRVDDVNGESLLFALCPMAVSTSSACSSARRQPSYVLKALGFSDKEALASVRLSFGRFTEEAEVQRVLEYTQAAIRDLQSLSTLRSA